MNADEFEQAWRSQDVQRVTLDAELLLTMVKRNHGEFRSMILRRDVAEIATSLALVALFAAWGVWLSSWSWLVMAASCLFIAAFMLADRRQQRQHAPSKTESVAVWLERTRSDVAHQIWLLKNVFWWYLLPPLIGLTCVYGHAIWQSRHIEAGYPFVAAILAGLFGGSCVVLYGVYRLNQWAVRNNLEPRLKELVALAESLTRDED